MKKLLLLLPLLFSAPSMAQTPEAPEQTKDLNDVVWLVMHASGGGPNSMTAIPTKNMEQCQAQGEIYGKKKFKSYSRFVCLEGVRP